MPWVRKIATRLQDVDGEQGRAPEAAVSIRAAREPTIPEGIITRALHPVYGKLVTLGVSRTFGVVAPPVWLMTLPISPLGPMQTVIKSWNLTLGLWGASKARVSTTPLFRKTL